MEETIAQKALRLLEPIPPENWCTDQYAKTVVEDGAEINQCCIIGHWTRLHSDDPNLYSNTNCNDILNFGTSFRNQTKKFLIEKFDLNLTDAADVNNGPYANGYTEPVIKDRCIHLLKDMVEAGY